MPHGEARSATGATGARYRGSSRSDAARSATTVPSASPNRPTGWSAGYSRRTTATGSDASCACRPGSGRTGSRGSMVARTREAGTTRRGSDGSIGVATSRSATTTARPAAGSSRHRSRASASSASSMMQRPRALGGGWCRDRRVARDLEVLLLLRVPDRECRVLERSLLLGVRRPGLLLGYEEQVRALVRDDERVARLADRRGEDGRFLLGRDLTLRHPADVATLLRLGVVGVVTCGGRERELAGVDVVAQLRRPLEVRRAVHDLDD